MDTQDPKHDPRDPYAQDPGAGRPDDERLKADPPASEERPEEELPATTRTGQTTRGEYATDPATGAGGYRDHTGTFTTDPVDQLGDAAPDPVDPQNG